MITLKDAYQMIKAKYPNEPIRNIGELADSFAFRVGDGSEAWETIDKKTGAFGELWIWDWLNLVDQGKVKQISINDVFKV